MTLDTKRNQFKRLRYEDNKTWKPTMTIEEVAKKTTLSTSAISKIENEGSASCNVDTIKKYKEAFPELELSYEYLIDGIQAKSQKYAEIGKRFPYNDSFFKTLEQIASNPKYEFDAVNLMNILFADSEEVLLFLRFIFKSLKEINDLKENKKLSKEFKILEQKKIEFAIASRFNELLTSDKILELLQPVFKLYNDYLANMNSSPDFVDIPNFNNNDVYELVDENGNIITLKG